MLCPVCRKKSSVYNSRPFENTTRRDRKCNSCGHKYTTLEVLAPTKEIVEKPPVAKKSQVKKRKPKRFVDDMIMNIDHMSDEELEARIFAGEFDDDEW